MTPVLAQGQLGSQFKKTKCNSTWGAGIQSSVLSKRTIASAFGGPQRRLPDNAGEGARATSSPTLQTQIHFQGEHMTRTIRILCVALLTIVGLVGSSLPTRADDDRRERCERRIHQAEDRLRDAVQRHGEDSRQAHKRREQLEQVRRDCHEFDRDHDHDHDHDHDQH